MSNGATSMHHGNCSFLLQNFYVREQAENFVMHLLVEDVAAGHRHLSESGLAQRLGVRMGYLPWKMREFVLFDPRGVLWHIAQNT